MSVSAQSTKKAGSAEKKPPTINPAFPPPEKRVRPNQPMTIRVKPLKRKDLYAIRDAYYFAYRLMLNSSQYAGYKWFTDSDVKRHSAVMERLYGQISTALREVDDDE